MSLILINSKFIETIPGWDAMESRLSVWIEDLKMLFGQEFLLQALGDKMVKCSQALFN